MKKIANRGYRGRRMRGWQLGCGAVMVMAGLLARLGQAAAQANLGVEGDHFTVNGQPRFLTFISYFDGLDAADSGSDLQYLRAQGFDGVRIFPNWWTTAGVSWAGDTLIRSDGSLDPDTVMRFHWFVWVPEILTCEFRKI